MFVDNNGLVDDPLELERQAKWKNMWTDEEKEIFLKKFLMFPKNFSKIASYLDQKSTQDVVLYYYANKRTLDLKKLVTEQQAKKASRTPGGRKTITTSGGGNLLTQNINANANNPPTIMPGSYWTLDSPLQRRMRLASVNYNENVIEQKGSASSASNNSSRRPTILGANSGYQGLNQQDQAANQQPGQGVNPSQPQQQENEAKWTEQEKEQFAEALDKFGPDFKAISAFLSTKNFFQCKNYYHNFKKRSATASNQTQPPPLPQTQSSEENLLEPAKKKRKVQKKVANFGPFVGCLFIFFVCLFGVVHF